MVFFCTLFIYISISLNEFSFPDTDLVFIFFNVSTGFGRLSAKIFLMPEDLTQR